jgi:hypothetical protein
MLLDLNEPEAHTAPMTSAALSLRHATPADDRAVAYLSELDETTRLHGDVLVAFAGERPVAAMSLYDGRTAADPFVPTEGAVTLLRTLARQERRSRAAGRRFGLGFLRLAL